MLPVKLNLRELLFETLKQFAMNGVDTLLPSTQILTYNTTHYKIITNTTKILKEESIIVDRDHISQDVVLSALSTIKTGKMCGIDRVCNEHLIHVGFMVKYLTFLIYCNMFLQH